jgi:hypothetical protein
MEPYLRCVSHSNVHPKLAKWSQSELTSKFNGSPTFQGKSARIWKTRQSLCWTKLVWWLIFSVKVRRVKNIFNQKISDIKNPLWSYTTYASVLLRNSNQQQTVYKYTTSRLILKLKYWNTKFLNIVSFWRRDWSPKFATGLNIIIGIDQKIYLWQGCSLAKMMYSKGNHFGKRRAWSLLYFLNYAYYDI